MVSSVNFVKFTSVNLWSNQSGCQEACDWLLRGFIDLNIVLVNSFKVGSLFSHKDRLPKAMCASLVYKFSCARCASEYVASTTRTLHTRVAEHAGRSFSTGSILSVPPHSMVRTHSESCGVPVTLDYFRIIGSISSAIDLRILESLHIFKLKPVLNDSQSSYPLSIVNIQSFSTLLCFIFILFFYFCVTLFIALCVCFLSLFFVVMSTF